MVRSGRSCGLCPPKELPERPVEVAIPPNLLCVGALVAILVEMVVRLWHMDHRRDWNAAQFPQKPPHPDCGTGATPLPG